MTDRIRFLLALDGAGAPLVTQCLGAMSDIVVLSRIHPLALDRVNPLEQAYKWFGLMTDADIERMKSQTDWPFHEIMQMIAERAEAKNQTLIIADWSDLDFISDKPVSEMSGIFLHPTALEARMEPTSVALVRHPVDQWIHLRNQLGKDAPGIEVFMRGYRRFSECLDGIETIRFEDFLADPGAVLQTLCGYLDAPFNSDWEAGWKDYRFVMGEPAREKPEDEPQVTLTDEIMAAFESNPDYIPTVEKLGYVNQN